MTQHIPLSSARRIVSHVLGKKVARSTIYRWSTAGVRGVRLETVTIAGQRYTTERAIDDFLNAFAGEPVTAAARGERETERILKERGMI